MIIAIIPARGGSKGVPGKNIRSLAGFPLIAYSIAACRLSQQIQRVIVSTDSGEIADVAIQFGAEVPFLRPSEISLDNSTDMEFILHTMDWFKKNENQEPDQLVHIRPTTPLRDPALIDDAIRKFLNDSMATALRSVHEIPESPYKMFAVRENGYLEGLFPDDLRPEYYNLPRQDFPPVYKPNGYVDIVSKKTIREGKSLHGQRMIAFITPVVTEVDSTQEFDFIAYELKTKKCDIFDYLTNHYPNSTI